MEGGLNLSMKHALNCTFLSCTSTQITNAIRPDVVFSAHLHISRTLTYPPMHLHTIDDSAVHEFPLRCETIAGKARQYLEIAVPTCSYRMGVARSGFGFAVIGE